MKHLIGASLISLMLSSAAVIAGEATVKLSVEGMSCISCAYAAEKALRSIDGVKEAKILAHEKMAIVTYDDTKSSVEQLVAAVTKVGFPTKLLDPNAPVPSE